MRKACALVLSLCIVLLLPACNTNSGTATMNATKNRPRELKLAFVTNNSADFWTIARRGVEKADSELADVSAQFKICSTAQRLLKKLRLPINAGRRRHRHLSCRS
jgi:ABC-type sugar transport system substrate-binding protein